MQWVNASLDVRALANSVLIEWVNNNNEFCVERDMPTAQHLALAHCAAGSPAQAFTVEADGSIRHGGSADACMDAYNCEKAPGTTIGLYKCHPDGTSECGYKNQQFKIDAATKTITNINSGSCLTLGGATGLQLAPCTPDGAKQTFAVSGGAIHSGDGMCLSTAASPGPGKGHCCAAGWVSQIDSQQDLTLDSLSGPGYWNDNDMLSVGCNEPGRNGTKGTPCAGYQTMLEQRGQFALWAVQASPLILGHDVTKMGAEVRAIITNPEMIALNQDPLGHRAEIVYQPDSYYRTITTFVKQLASPSSPRAVAVFNRGEAAEKVTVTRAQLGFAAGSCACVDLRDVDTHKDVATGVKAEALITVSLLPHEVQVLRATCC